MTKKLSLKEQARQIPPGEWVGMMGAMIIAFGIIGYSVWPAITSWWLSESSSNFRHTLPIFLASPIFIGATAGLVGIILWIVRGGKWSK